MTEDQDGTEDQEIEQALAELDGLHDTPVATHFDRLARAHEALHRALDRSGPPTPSP